MKNDETFPPLVEDKKAEEIQISAIENTIENKLNVQRNAYQLTINNPRTEGFNHRKIKEILTLNFSTLVYFCLADEIAETGTPHTHIYVIFRSRVRWSTIKRHFPTAHIQKGRNQSAGKFRGMGYTPKAERQERRHGGIV